MNKLIVDLENCYGIKKLKKELDFTKHNVYAIYAANGAMKSSLAQTFKDIYDEIPSKDRIFPNRVSKRKIIDETGVDLSKECVFVIQPYEDGKIEHTEKTSTLLVDSKLRKEYEDLFIEIDKSKEIFIKALKEQSGSKKDLEKEVSSAFMKSDEEFFLALIRVKEEVLSQKDALYADVDYDIIFDEKVINFLGTQDVKAALESYIIKYNELLSASTYFKKGIFNYYNAATIAKNLADNGFFEAKHSVNLNATEKMEITTRKQLEDLIQEEKDSITNDKDLKKKFAELDKLMYRNVNVRNFRSYIDEHEDLISELSNIDLFKEKIWKSYFKSHFELYIDLINKYLEAEQRKKEIEIEAGKQRTQWESAIEKFNERFYVPFKLEAKNRISVILGQETMLSLAFTFEDGADHASVNKDSLMQVLSTGEKRAFYILNIIFEVEARKKAKQETLFIFDDIADSFDYKNKYAIIQYLKDIAEDLNFKQIILTHNFDFFRTINSRFVEYSHCLMAIKSSKDISLEQATGIKNVFVNDWKKNYFSDIRKKIASIPFIRNIIEFTKGDNDPDYLKLTSLLHWKKDSVSITENDLDNIFISVFNATKSSNNSTDLVIDLITREADDCLNACIGINFENKIVLSLAIRILAEKFMVNKINDSKFTDNIMINQTPKLLDKFKELFSGDTNSIDTIQRVVLMTPENIHVNSFMYEPILDMSDEHLRNLYSDVKSLK